MTIAAGFKCRDGIVICADSQESGNGFKHAVVKLEFRPEVAAWAAEDDKPSAIFTGAGDSAFVDEVIDVMWSAVEDHGDNTLATVIARMQEANREYHDRIWKPYPCLYSTESLPDADLLIAAHAGGKFGLYRAMSTRFTEVKNYAAIGCGGDLADYLCSGALYSSSRPLEVANRAIYMLEQVKNNVEGCGGQSHIAVLSRSGEPKLLEPPETARISQQMLSAERAVKAMLILSADLGVADQDVRRMLRFYETMLLDARRERRRDMKKWENKFVNMFGKAVKRKKPKPSGSQT